MLDRRRKSMQPMAARPRVDHQRLQQFVTSSPRNVEPVRKTLSRKVFALIKRDACVIDDTGFVKDDDASPCAARQYSRTLGNVGNCQIAVGVHAACDTASAPLDWRLYVPERWDERCSGELIEWGRTPPVLNADAGYGDTIAFRQGLTDRKVGYVIAAKGATSAYLADAVPETAPYAARGRPPVSRHRHPHQPCGDLAMAAGRAAGKTVT